MNDILNPVISVIVPCYNGADYLNACLKSLSLQRVEVPWEVVFVDDGSFDSSLQQAKQWIPKFSGNGCLKIVQNKVNRGLPLTRKVGLHEASGQYIIFCDVDDVLSFGFLSIVHEVFSTSVIDMLVTPVCRFVNEPNFDLRPYQLTIRTSDEALREFGENHFGGGWIWNKVWKKEVIERAFERLTDLGRFDVDYELTTLGYSISEYVGSATGLMYAYRDTPGSMVKSEKSLGFGFTESLNNYRNLCKSGISNQDLMIVRSVFLARLLWSQPGYGQRVSMPDANSKRCEEILADIQEIDHGFMADLVVAQAEMLISVKRSGVSAIGVREMSRILLQRVLKRFVLFFSKK